MNILILGSLKWSFPFFSNYILLCLLPTNPLSPIVNLQILVTEINTFLLVLVQGISFQLLLFMFGDQFLNSRELYPK